MTLADRYAAGPPGPRRPGPSCTVGRAILAFKDADREALLGMLHPDSGWGHEEIAVTLADYGHSILAGTISRHRRGGCRCEFG